MKKKSYCLGCDSSGFKEIIFIKRFPAFFGAVPTLNHLKKIPFHPLSVSECQNCGLVQQVNLINESIMNEVYTADYYNIPSPIVTGMGKEVVEDFYKFILKHNKKKGKILEIASLDGYLLLLLDKIGYDVFGCDPGSLSSNAAKNIGSNKIKKTFFNSSTYPKKSFDFIVFRNLLEHIYNPKVFLLSIYKTLKDNGKIFIEVPDIRYFENYGGFGSFFHQHIFYFSIKTLSNLLNDNKFKIEQYRIYEGKIFVMASKYNNRNKNHNLYFGRKFNKNKMTSENAKLRKKIIETFKKKSNKKIALFGASSVSTSIAQVLDTSQRKKISHVFDNDTDKHGLFCVGINKKILSPSNINLANQSWNGIAAKPSVHTIAIHHRTIAPI